jgi:hypothetical protein
MSKKIMAITAPTIMALALSACSSMCKVEDGNRTAAAETTPTIPTETFNFKTPVTKVMITNTTGTTNVHNTATVGTASLNVSKVKTSQICEFNQEQKGSTLLVSVRNKGFTGAGDCEINIEVAVPATTEVNVTSTTGPVEIGLPNATQPNVTFESTSGRMTTDFKTVGKGTPKITVRTQSGGLTVKAL